MRNPTPAVPVEKNGSGRLSNDVLETSTAERALILPRPQENYLGWHSSTVAQSPTHGTHAFRKWHPRATWPGGGNSRGTKGAGRWSWIWCGRYHKRYWSDSWQSIWLH